MSLILVFGGTPINYTLTCDAGSYTYTGNAATLTVARRLTCAAGAYVYTGQSATLTLARKLSLAAGAYVYTGQAATLTLARRLSLAAGAYTYTGQAATLTVGRRLSLAAGSYTYTGQPATFTVARGMALATGAYVYTGQAATLTYAHTVALEPGAYSYIGHETILSYFPGSNVPFTAGGAGYPVWHKKPKATPSNSIDKLWDLVLEDYYKGILEKAPQKDKKKAAAIVRPYADKAGKSKSIPAPAQIDWAAIEANSEKVSALLQLWQEQVLNKQLDDDDELLLMLMD